MKIGFIGAGKSWLLPGAVFCQGGLPVTGYYSRHRGSAQEAAAWTGTKQYESLESLVRASDALFLTVPDGAIASVFAQLREFDLAGKQICHCSGALTAREAFPGVEETGAGHYSIHPLFPPLRQDRRLAGITGCFFLPGGPWPPPGLVGGAAGFSGGQGADSPQPGKRGLPCRLHRGQQPDVCAGSGECGTVAGLRVLPAGGPGRIGPLMKANLAHLLQVGPQQALTGPVERGDTATVAKHLACLTGEDARQVYRGASRMLVELARNKHPDIDAESMNEILKEGSNR